MTGHLVRKTLGERVDTARSYADRLAEVVSASRVTGARVHDARVAALCLFTGFGSCGRRTVISHASPR